MISKLTSIIITIIPIGVVLYFSWIAYMISEILGRIKELK